MNNPEHMPFFRDGNQATQHGEHLYALQNHYVHQGREFASHAEHDLERSNNHVEGLSQARALFDELSQTYGVSNAGFMPVVGKTAEGRVGEYVVSHKVHGIECVNPKQREIPEVQRKAATSLLGDLTQYVTDKHASQEPMLDDVYKLEQYMYQPQSDSMILVDMDPYFSNELSEVFAYTGLMPLARQLLGKKDFEAWDIHMKTMAEESAHRAVDLAQDF